MSRENSTEDINNANNNTANESTSMEEKETECRTVSNNNWWGSWISSAKTKVGPNGHDYFWLLLSVLEHSDGSHCNSLLFRIDRSVGVRARGSQT